MATQLPPPGRRAPEIEPHFGDLPPSWWPRGQDPYQTTELIGNRPLKKGDVGYVELNVEKNMKSPNGPTPKKGTEIDVVANGLESGELTEAQAEAFLDAYMAILETLVGFEGSLGINLGERLQTLTNTLTSNPDAVLDQMETLAQEVRLTHTQVIDQKQFEADQTQQLFANEMARLELEAAQRATDVSEATSLRAARMQQAQMEQRDSRANLAAFQEAARLQQELATGAMGARQDFWEALVGRTGGLPYMGAAGPSPSGAGLHDLVQGVGGQAVAPYEMTGGPIGFPDLTQTPEFQRALEIQDELARRQIETPVVDTTVTQSDLMETRSPT